ncbi:hypothetical protein TNCV_2210161 [Trichonephila clavipes]|nr:hypothetical protein TNCV_2210161 [Trichonephila clavipes]
MGRKPRLVDEDRDHSSRRKDDEQDEGIVQTNAGIWSGVVWLMKNLHVCILSTSPGVVAGRSYSALERVVHAQWYTSTFLRCLSTTVIHIPGGGLDAVDLLLALQVPRTSHPWISSSGATWNHLCMKLRCP